MGQELEPRPDRVPIMPELIDYLKADRHRKDLESGRPIININYYEAPRPAPAPPPEPNIATKYAGHMILATWSLIVLAGVGVIFTMIAGALMTMMISTAVCAVAVAGALRSLRSTQRDADREKRRRHR